MQNDKSPSNDGLTKEFQEKIWDELIEIFVDSGPEFKEKGHLSTSRRQVFIKLIAKSYRDSKFILTTHLLGKCRSQNKIKNSF